MAHHINFEEAQVYVGTYGKYNSGSIFGKWLKISDYSDKAEFYKACAALHANEYDPEFMFQDWENIPDGMISECSISEKVFELWDHLEPLSESEREAFLLWCNNDHKDFDEEDIEALVESFQEDYMGQYEDEEAFARELVSERNDLSEFALQYFDYESYARTLFCDGYWYSDGHVFCD